MISTLSRKNKVKKCVALVYWCWTLMLLLMLMTSEASSSSTNGVVGFVIPTNYKHNNHAAAASLLSPSMSIQVQTNKNDYTKHNKKNDSLLVLKTTTGGGSTTNIDNDETEAIVDDTTHTTLSSSFTSAQSAISLLTKELKILPILSIFSGISPSTRIIAESHISRLPDCPIAHEIDTMLLWPAIASSTASSSSNVDVNLNAIVDNTSIIVPPRTIFQYPFAAVTDESLYDVNWKDVWMVFFENVGISLLYSFLISFALIKFVENIDDDEQ